MDIPAFKAKLDAARYIYDDSLVTTLLVALRLGRPLLIEGAAGVGKTEIAKVMASALDRDLVRLQCYEGLDESKALYEWNYQKQLLSIQVQMNRQDPDALTKSLFSDEYLLERPIRADVACIYGSVADKYGNVKIHGTARNFNTVMAAAADTVICQADEVVEMIDPDEVLIQGVLVDYIVGGKN